MRRLILGLSLFLLAACSARISVNTPAREPSSFMRGSAFYLEGEDVRPVEQTQHTYDVRLFGVRPSRNGGHVIIAPGLDTSDYIENPIVLSIHDSSSWASVVGQCRSVSITQNEARATIQLLPRPAGWEGNWLPDQLDYLLQRGIAGVSVYIVIQSAREPTAQDKLLWGDECKIVVEKCALIEISVVPLGAFPDAVPRRGLAQ